MGYRLVGKHRYDDFRLERLQELPFIVMPSVFNPKVPRTGEFLASQIDSTLVQRDCEVLDMGTGSGVCAVFAAKHARRVVAVDINPAAVRCARINALAESAGAQDRRAARGFVRAGGRRMFRSDPVQSAVRAGQPHDDRDRAWRSNDVAERFAAGLGDHLKPGGSALVLLSTFGDGLVFLDEFHKQRFEISVLAERRFVNERLTLFRLRQSAGAPGDRGYRDRVATCSAHQSDNHGHPPCAGASRGPESVSVARWQIPVDDHRRQRRS